MELLQNAPDWSTYIVMPIIFAVICGLGFAMVSRRAGMAAFLIVATLALANTYTRFKPAFSEADIAELNRDLPADMGGVTLKRVTFSDRTLSYHLSVPGHADENLMTAIRRNAVPYACKKLGRLFRTKRLEQVVYVFNDGERPNGSQITASDCL
ncbi:MAG: hypothetical protein EOR30_28040 [Mesorhizobium sp.]|uniref:hypothetical protein n=1 Tax=unclassified Mesorhizobium TaxID=325217 RepID=UPI000FCC82F0|nr:MULTISPECIES: hypothetical protein [unclassified Mesorhizobium]RUV71648.1 hypothetical protein EOA78_16910 [Mesorhizobium sp. M5C.F.Cr.IN.023.01.1.1]RWF88064.1 MAG: hypothetical protein EOQ36_09730 [Mesorhizobium sp.]RWF91972.1 MAG: hypothetical protein EOQ45_23145 [Mesorhizobium sp.]RWI42735.1 MAG: hypothetical protein EOR14_06460 [Mesorhizobium sp.]RWI53203.1 MAG: hypothetical protein EOR15_00085 [Mesorhizobium sp.]